MGWQLLVDAARWENWTDVRCANCGEAGHPMCEKDIPDAAAPKAKSQPGVQAATAARVGAALRGNRGAGPDPVVPPWRRSDTGDKRPRRPSGDKRPRRPTKSARSAPNDDARAWLNERISRSKS